MGVLGCKTSAFSLLGIFDRAEIFDVVDDNNFIELLGLEEESKDFSGKFNIEEIALFTEGVLSRLQELIIQRKIEI